MEATPHFLAEELDAVFTDIFPDAVKIGMVSSSGLIEVIAEKLRFYKARHIVSTRSWSPPAARACSRRTPSARWENALLPLAEVCTPNIPEAEILSELEIKSPTDMERAAKAISERFGCAVLCKGGHDLNDANDLLYADGEARWFYGKRIDNPNHPRHRLHALERGLRQPRQGLQPPRQRRAREAYLSGALSDMLDLGRGRGPMNHAFDIKTEYKAEAR